MPGATTTLVPLSVTPELVELTKVVTTSDGITATPFNRSLTSTFVNEVPPVKPFTVLPASATASITEALTGTRTRAVSQLVGLRISQIR